MIGRIALQRNAGATAMWVALILAGCSSGGNAGSVGAGGGSGNGGSSSGTSSGVNGGDDVGGDDAASGGGGTSSSGASTGDDGAGDADDGNPDEPDATTDDADTPDDAGTGSPLRDASTGRPRRDAGATSRDAGTSASKDASAATPDAGAAPAGDGGDALAAARTQCVQIINQDRATLSPPSPPLTEDTAEESCVDGQAKADYQANMAHSAFGNCHEFAQDECPGWPGPPSSIDTKCLAQMWAEGPPPAGQDNHWLNMSNAKYTKVACGFYQTPSGSWWATQDFY
jgi:hypothetical protein